MRAVLVVEIFLFCLIVDAPIPAWTGRGRGGSGRRQRHRGWRETQVARTESDGQKGGKKSRKFRI
jgi:hypothetical protein